MKLFRFLNLFLLLLFTFHFSLFTSIAFAHDTGQSLETVVGAYKIDVGYDTTPFRANETIRFDFNVIKEGAGDSVEFSDVWVRVIQGNKTVFASGIHKPNLGKAGMTFTFPDGGGYDLSVRFQNNSQTIAETSFPITVEPSIQEVGFDIDIKAARKKAWIGWVVAGVSLCGIALTFLYTNRRRLAQKRSQ